VKERERERERNSHEEEEKQKSIENTDAKKCRLITDNGLNNPIASAVGDTF
jgi:hypothetical protein